MNISVARCVSAAAAAILVSSLAAAPQAQAAGKYCDGPKIHWKYSLWGKRRAVTEGSEYVSQAVKDATCGNFDIKLYYGEQLSKAKENLDSLKLGAIDAGFICSSYHPGKVPALGVLDLPFLPISDFETMIKVYDTLWAQPALQQSLAKWNSRRFLQNILPMYEYMGRGEPPKGLADFKGKRLRALGGMGEAARAIGATPSTVPASETYTALQRGTVDAIGFPFSYTFSAYKLDEISDWYTTNLSAGNVNCFMAINNSAYDALPPQYVEILEGSKAGAYQAMIKAYAEKDEINLARWRKEGKMVEVRFSEADLEEFRKVGGKPVWDKWVEDNKAEVPDARGLIDLVLETAKKGS